MKKLLSILIVAAVFSALPAAAQDQARVAAAADDLAAQAKHFRDTTAGYAGFGPLAQYTHGMATAAINYQHTAHNNPRRIVQDFREVSIRFHRLKRNFDQVSHDHPNPQASSDFQGVLQAFCATRAAAWPDKSKSDDADVCN